MSRETGWYRAKWNGRWLFSQFYNGKFHLDGIERGINDEEFDEIDKIRIDPNPHNTTKVKNEYAHKLFDEVEKYIDEMTPEQYEELHQQSIIENSLSEKITALDNSFHNNLKPTVMKYLYHRTPQAIMEIKLLVDQFISYNTYKLDLPIGKSEHDNEIRIYVQNPFTNKNLWSNYIEWK